MLRFSRSDVSSDDRKTRIVDGPAAKAWLARMAQPASTDNLAEIRQVLETLGAQGAQDRVAALTAERKFAIADRIRGVVLPLLGDRAREDRFTVLPLDDDFSQHFWAAVNAATALRDVYAWLVSQLPEVPARPEPSIGDDRDATPDATPAAHHFVTRVGALHRALDVNAYVMLCVQRARWAVPAVLWERHCTLGQLVRDLDCQDIEVSDALRVSATKTCRAAFVLPVMIALADPSVRTGVEFEMIRMAAQRWSAKVGFRLEKRSDGAAPPARPVVHPGPTVTLGACVLRFDTQSALHSIDKRLEALAEGRSPREAGIGDSLRPQVARDLLLVLKQPDLGTSLTYLPASPPTSTHPTARGGPRWRARRSRRWSACPPTRRDSARAVSACRSMVMAPPVRIRTTTTGRVPSRASRTRSTGPASSSCWAMPRPGRWWPRPPTPSIASASIRVRGSACDG